MKRIILSAIVMAGFSAGLYAANNLEGSVWEAKFDDQQGTEDTLVFVNGQFVSTKCVPYGYKTSSYSENQSSDATQWKTEQKSGKDKMSWTGAAKGNTMDGQFVHTSADGSQSTTKWSATKAE